MNIINKKFKYLLDNVFCNINNVNDKKISQLNPSECIFKINVVHKQYKKTKMELQFCNFNKLKYTNTNISSDITKILKNPVVSHDKININESELKVPKPIVKEISVANINHDTTRTSKININTQTNKLNCPCNYLNEFIEKDSKLDILSINKAGDYLSTILLSALSPLFYNLPDNDKVDELKSIKLELITIFNKENYYRNYDYSTKHFKKIEADDILSNNLPITVNMLKIYGDIISLNIVYIYDNKIKFITKFNNSRATVIISETKSKVYTTTYSCYNKFLRGIDCIKILSINTKFSKCTLESKKLDELQNIAKMLNLDIKKQGKTGRVNIKKEELIDMIAL